MSHQIIYSSVNSVIVNDVEYCIIRIIFNHKKDELHLLVDIVR